VKNAIELNKRSEDILYLSYHDKLTNLYNRRFYEEKVSLFDDANNLPISFIIGDVNGLKLTNDAYGHEAGDNLLIKITQILNECCRVDDIISRTGGDEFLMILPQTTSFEAAKIAANIKARCSEEKGNPIQPSISLGVSTKNHLSQDIKSIYKLAEDRMYSSKLTESKNVKDSIILSLRKTLQHRLKDDV
jgi:diguanylate cyclase (GGDEF)-like protein